MNNDGNSLPQAGTFSDSNGNNLAPADHLLTIKRMTLSRLLEVSKWLRYQGSVVYFIGAARGSLVKIGTASNLANRLRALQTGSPVELRVLAAVAGNVDDERRYHRLFAEHRSHGEWYHRAPVIRAEMTRLQDLGIPSPGQQELAERSAAIRRYWREESKRQKAARLSAAGGRAGHV